MTTPPALTHRPYRVSENRLLNDGIFQLTLAPSQPEDALVGFEAGQWAYLEIFNEDGSLWARSAYSIASAPSEYPDGTIVLAIKRAGDFTTRASELRSGDAVALQGPFGRFTFDLHGGPSIFLSGGIGVTPFRSMIHEAVAQNFLSPLVLLSSCRTSNDLPYHEEFQQLAESHASFRYVPICTRMDPSEWSGEHERISAELIRRVSDGNMESATFYLCGHKDFAESMKALLLAEGVLPMKIRFERFS